MAFSVTNSFTNGTLTDAPQMNANFDDVENELNGITYNASTKYMLLGRATTSATTNTLTVGWTSSGWKSIEIQCRFKVDSTDITDAKIRFNGDSGANYDFIGYVDNGTSSVRATSVGASSFAFWNLVSNSKTGGDNTLNLHMTNLTSSLAKVGDANFRTSRENLSLYQIGYGNCQWNNTSVEITSCALSATNNFKTGAILDVYGIK